MTSLLARLSRLLDMVLACVMLLMVALACINVALRYVWGNSFLWADEALVFAMVGVTFLGVISVSARSEHLRMSLLAHALGPRMRTVLQVAERLLVAFVCFYVATFSWKVVTTLQSRGTLSNMAEVPLWMLHMLVMCGLVGMALVSVLQLFVLLRRGTEDSQ